MEIVVRATIIYFFLWAIARGLGKRELSQMNAFELILLVTMGDLVQQAVTQEDMSVTGSMIAVGTIASWIVLFSWLSFRFKRLRPALEGVSVVVVRDGQMVDDALRLEHLTLEEIQEAGRNQGLASFDDVVVGVLEPDGRVSFVLRDGKQHQPDDKRATT